MKDGAWFLLSISIIALIPISYSIMLSPPALVRLENNPNVQLETYDYDTLSPVTDISLPTPEICNSLETYYKLLEKGAPEDIDKEIKNAIYFYTGRFSIRANELNELENYIKKCNADVEILAPKIDICNNAISENSEQIIDFMKSRIDVHLDLKNISLEEQEPQRKLIVTEASSMYCTDCLSYYQAYYFNPDSNKTLVARYYKTEFKSNEFSCYDFYESVVCEIGPNNTLIKMYASSDVDCSRCGCYV
jgi:hypothetical protein